MKIIVSLSSTASSLSALDKKFIKTFTSLHSSIQKDKYEDSNGNDLIDKYAANAESIGEAILRYYRTRLAKNKFEADPEGSNGIAPGSHDFSGEYTFTLEDSKGKTLSVEFYIEMDGNSDGRHLLYATVSPGNKTFKSSGTIKKPTASPVTTVIAQLDKYLDSKVAN